MESKHDQAEIEEQKELIRASLKDVIETVVGKELLEHALDDADTVELLFAHDGEFLPEEDDDRREVVLGAMIVWGVVLGASMARLGCTMPEETRLAIERVFPHITSAARKRAARWAKN